MQVSENIDVNQVENMVFVGLVGIIDPPRVEVNEAIQKAQQAGIRVIMATGDHKSTALAIAQSIGLAQDTDEALEESEIISLSDKDLYKTLQKVSVLARLSPHTKLRVATILQQNGHIVAMTGDGVNDAPALRKADIGIAMGIRGTDVAKEASDIVLTDDNFVSIIAAVEEGRVVFRNIRQTSMFLIISSITGVIVFMLTLIFGYSLPLLAIQVLCLNLVTNGLLDIALATERSHKNILLEKPYSAHATIIPTHTYSYMAVMIVTMTLISFGVFVLYQDAGIEAARTMFFWILAMMQLANSYNMRSAQKSLLEIGVWSNRVMNGIAVFLIGLILLMIYQPFLQRILQFSPINIYDALLYGVIAVIGIIGVGEMYKWVRIK
jgi:Ca2+-transporting ATPase